MCHPPSHAQSLQGAYILLRTFLTASAPFHSHSFRSFSLATAASLPWLFLLQVPYTVLPEWFLKFSSNQIVLYCKNFRIYDILFGLTFKGFHDTTPLPSFSSYLLGCNLLPFAWIGPELPCLPTFAHLFFLLQCSVLHLSTLRSFPPFVYLPQPV